MIFISSDRFLERREGAEEAPENSSLPLPFHVISLELLCKLLKDVRVPLLDVLISEEMVVPVGSDPIVDRISSSEMTVLARAFRRGRDCGERMFIIMILSQRQSQSPQCVLLILCCEFIAV